MHPRTIATLKELEAVEWFRNVGVKDTQAVLVLSSWDEAMTYCNSREWESLTLAAANQLRRLILEASRDRYVIWNQISGEVRAHIGPFVADKCRSVVERHNLPKSFIDAVNWDIGHLCLEAEYADLVPPAFFSGNAYWYVSGHFPCGWEGDYPGGRPVVY